MTEGRTLYRALVIVFALAAVAYLAGGGLGIFEGHWIGWYSFLLLSVVLIALVVIAFVQAVRSR